MRSSQRQLIICTLTESPLLCILLLEYSWVVRFTLLRLPWPSTPGIREDQTLKRGEKNCSLGSRTYFYELKGQSLSGQFWASHLRRQISFASLHINSPLVSCLMMFNSEVLQSWGICSPPKAVSTSLELEILWSTILRPPPAGLACGATTGKVWASPGLWVKFQEVDLWFRKRV